MIKTRLALTGVLIFSYIIEILQYFRFVEMIGLDHLPMANTIIGTSFSWIDLVMYTAGMLFVAILDLIIARSHRFNPKNI